MRKAQWLAWTLSAAVALGTTAASALSADDQAMQPSGQENKSLYWTGHEALREQRWGDAVKRFVELEQRLRRDQPEAVDAALYWQAYAQAKARRAGEARATVERLHTEFPRSRWSEEADQLLVAGDVAGRESGDAGDEEEDLVGAALNGLLAAPPERALPLLNKVLEGRYPPETKKRALFVLSQLDADAATQVVLRIARQGPGPLRDDAVAMLGLSGSDAAHAALDSLYRDKADVELRQAVMKAWMMGGNSEAIARAAQDESDPVVRMDAIHMLGALGATDRLRPLLDGGDDATRIAVIEALAIGGDTVTLAEIARSDRPIELRERALQGLGIAGDGAALESLYPSMASAALRDAVLQGLMISGDSKRLRALYASSSDPNEKRRILRMLTSLGGDDMLDLIEQAIDEGASK